MNHNYSNVLVLLFIVIMTSGMKESNQHSDLKKSMVTFDQYYIPALALTNEGNKEASRKAIKKLTNYWEKFSVKYFNYQTPDNEWQTDLNQITKSIAKANLEIKNDVPLPKIHDTLENVRLTFMQLRHRNKIDYFPDYLTAYHGPMEHISMLIKGKTVKNLSESDLRDIADLFPTIDHLWSATLKAALQPDLFGFNKQQTKQAKQLIRQEEAAIKKLKTALQNNNRSEILASVKMLKPSFVKLYLMFGNFKGLK